MQIFDTWDRNVISLIVFLIVAILGWLIWIVLQWWLAFRVYTDEQFPAPAITREHIEALRKMRFAWDTRIESGGPVVDPFTPYGSESMAADLGPLIGTRGPVAVAKFHREVSEVLIWALHECALAPGQYRLAHLTNSPMQQRLRQDLAGLPDARIEEIVAQLPRLEPDGYFQFTDQHRRLLHRLRFEWPAPQHMWMVARGGYPVPAVHFKRPFGDMTAFDIDMAAILELPRPAPHRLDPQLERLYWEMWPALQTFVEHATIEVPSASRTGEACGRVAAGPNDKARATGIPGGPVRQIGASAEIEARRAALAARPDDAQATYQLARALHKTGGAAALAEAARLHRLAVERGDLRREHDDEAAHLYKVAAAGRTAADAAEHPLLCAACAPRYLH